ncbi:MAG: uracil-DNA glycosylase [Tissierellia bacterium]|nr:uracil-DNA glycosylase [Tissierellia bacterium]
MKQIFKNNWHEHLHSTMEGENYQQLRKKLIYAYKNGVVYPPANEIFFALHTTDYNDVKVVILGQDPYPGQGQANGMAFSVNRGIPIPKSLNNIYKELREDIGCSIPSHGDLTSWAKQGVLLLNTGLTVAAGQPASHRGWGWEEFTDKIILSLNERKEGIVFILWGAHAGEKSKLIDKPQHKILKSPHPSPLSAYRGFFGSRPFSKTNELLIQMGREPIQWCIE